jgi:hypothetical protein
VKRKNDEHSKKLIDLETHFDKKENELFKVYHEDRLRRIKAEIEEGIIDHLPNGLALPEEDVD